jgi:hypothetical protein
MADIFLGRIVTLCQSHCITSTHLVKEAHTHLRDVGVGRRAEGENKKKKELPAFAAL